MKIISLANVEKKKVDMPGSDGISKQIPLSDNDGVPVHAWRVFTIAPGGNTPYHNHPYEHMNYIIEGEGFLVNENGDRQHVKQGDFALVMPDEKHQYRNASNENKMVMICAVPKEFE